MNMKHRHKHSPPDLIEILFGSLFIFPYMNRFEVAIQQQRWCLCVCASVVITIIAYIKMMLHSKISGYNVAIRAHES